VKDIIEIEIDCIESGQIGESIKRPAERVFLLPNENYYFVNERFAKYAARSPDEEIGVFDVLDIGRQFHDYRSLGVKVPSMIQVESQTFRRGFASFEHLDLQWRLVGREGVDSNGVGGLPVRKIKRGL